MIIPSRRSAPVAAAAAAAVAGAIVALHYHSVGLTLSHYDARGHLVVARRIADSITPGWQQVGAVWLPLPHLLNFLPAQVDWLYRTGAAAVAISIASFAVGAGAIAWIVIGLTGSAAAALLGAALFVINPNVLYLQATPMTEPLLLALTLVAVALLGERHGSVALSGATPGRSSGSVRGRASDPPAPAIGAAAVGWAFALACMTRYEAWPVTISALIAAVWAWWRNGVRLVEALRRAGTIARYPALAVAAFALYSRVVIGEWFTTGGFFVPENKALNRPLLAAAEVWWGAHALSGGWLTMILGAAGLGALLVAAALDRKRAGWLIPLSLLTTAAIPWLAFVKGHPFRIRYMVPLLAAEAIGAGIAVGMFTRAAPVAAILAAAALAAGARPLDRSAPMVLEAQWDVPNVRARERVTDCLRAHYDGDTIMASMGSLGHYMQEASRRGFAVRNFLHEGNGDIWLAALEGPRPFAGWLLIEEKAEGGDMLAAIARQRPAFLDGYERVCSEAGLALYRRSRPSAQP
ncbi:MAG: hypothetical protein ABI868_23225 [Acidobacteriota bacterium]